MAIDPNAPVTRRALLGTAMAGLGALAATIARPLGVTATDTSQQFRNDENNNVVVHAISAESGPNTGGGIGVYGYSYHNSGVYGESLNEFGVRGDSVNGRGGYFKGRKAQIRLQPGGAGTHPASGAAGDLFVDRRKRLWFCKGGTTWVRVA